MGNKESQFNGGGREATSSLVDGRGDKDNQMLNPGLIKSFTEFTSGDTAEQNLEKFQIVRILTNIRQYRLLSSLYDKAVRVAGGDDHFYWHQLSLALICDHRHQRAVKVLNNCLTQTEATTTTDSGGGGGCGGKFDDQTIMECMHLARLQIEQFGDLDLAESKILKAISLSNGTWLSGRCHLLLAMIYSLKAQYCTSFNDKKSLTAESIANYERVIELDPHDDSAHLFCALEYANSRNLEMARERCQSALDLNMESPFAIMLMALIFTARKDYKGTLQLVINALGDFPTHYGLLVLRLKLEAKYGRVEEALQTSRNLICFWRKTRMTADFQSDEETLLNGIGDIGGGERAGDNLLGGRQLLSSKEAIIMPMTPLLTAPLGIAATPASNNHYLSTHPNFDSFPSNDNLSTIGPVPVGPSQIAPPSEVGIGGAGPSSTDSISILSTSRKSWISYSAFRLQADIWVELAEFFIEQHRLGDVQACVEEACLLYPNSHQALYLKGHLYLTRAEKCGTDASLRKRLRTEAKNCLLGAISICTGHVPSHSCLGQIYYAERNLKMAEKMLRDSVAIDPFIFGNWHRLGCVLAELGRNDESLECFQTAASLDANTPLIPFNVIPRILGTN